MARTDLLEYPGAKEGEKIASKPRFLDYHGEPYLVSASDEFLNSVADDDTPETIYMRREEALQEEIGRVLSKLPKKEADCLLQWAMGKSQQEIADSENPPVTQAAISIRCSKALEKLYGMRDRGEIATLRKIWEGFDQLKRDLGMIVDLERRADDSVETEVLEFTDAERAVLGALDSGPKHLNDIKKLCWPEEPRGYSWTRNGLRKLVKFGLVKKVGRGRYTKWMA